MKTLMIITTVQAPLITWLIIMDWEEVGRKELTQTTEIRMEEVQASRSLKTLKTCKPFLPIKMPPKTTQFLRISITQAKQNNLLLSAIKA